MSAYGWYFLWRVHCVARDHRALNHIGVPPEAGNVEVEFPGAAAIKMEMVIKRHPSAAHELAALHVAGDDWFAVRVVSLWLFHPPPCATGLPDVPVIASTRSV